MSLFPQTLVLRGILFREQEHRQERIGVGMTLWPTGPTRREEANEIEIGNFNTILALLAYHEFAQEHGWFAPGHGVSDSRNDNCVAPSELEPDL